MYKKNNLKLTYTTCESIRNFKKKKKNMNLFQSIQKSLTIISISSNQHRLNFKILMTFILYWSLAILYCEFREYMDMIYLTSSTRMITLCFRNFVWKMEKIFQLIHNVEKIIEISE